MACPPEQKILEYVDGEIAGIEQSLIRDHLLTCPGCRRCADGYARLNQMLLQPADVEPPAWLVPQIMKKIYPELPRYSSIAAMIAASAVFFVTWIYIYFDFSRSSLIQALQLTADRTSGWLTGAIKAISAIYSSVQAVFKASRALLDMLLGQRPEAQWLFAFVLAFSGLLLAFMTRLLLKKTRGKRT
jgi:predicted anti-sigma-YlaC factor YlaD